MHARDSSCTLTTLWSILHRRYQRECLNSRRFGLYTNLADTPALIVQMEACEEMFARQNLTLIRPSTVHAVSEAHASRIFE